MNLPNNNTPFQPYQYLGLSEVRNAHLLREFCVVFYQNSKYEPAIGFEWDITEMIKWAYKVSVNKNEAMVLALQIGKLSKDITFCIAIHEEGRRLTVNKPN